MSKLTKLINNPSMFFQDAVDKRLGLKTKIETAKEASNNKTVKQVNKLTKSQNMKIPQEKYNNYLLQAKQSIAINQFKYKDLHLWPLLRSELMVQLEVAFNKQVKKSNYFNPYLTQLCRPSNAPYEKCLDLASNLNYMNFVDDIEFENIDVLFFSNLNSTDHVLINGKIYNRLIDPLFDVLKDDFNCKKIEIIKATSAAVEKIPSYYNRPTCILPSSIYKCGQSSEANLPYNFIEKLNSKIPVIEFTVNRLESFIDWQLHMVDFYIALLKKFNPKIILFHPYYYNMPLIIAAKSLGILTCDIQHGIMHGYNSILYDNWQELPKEGYKALPDIFFTWSDKESEYLNNCVFDDNEHHRAITIGYKWLDYQPIIGGNSLINMVDELECDYKVLVTLQKDNSIPSNLIKIMRDNRDILWIVRAHPKGNKIKDDQIAGVEKVIFGKSVDEIIISELFKVVDFNITPGSTTVLEADFYNVKSIVYSKEGAINYRDYIDQGLVKYLPSEKSILEYNELEELKKSPLIGYFNNDIDYLSTFRKLIGGGEN